MSKKIKIKKKTKQHGHCNLLGSCYVSTTRFLKLVDQVVRVCLNSSKISDFTTKCDHKG